MNPAVIERMKRIRDNEALVVDLMNYSPFGALGQVFVVEAIRKWSDLVAASTAKDDTNALVSMETWIAVAKDVKERCDHFYNRVQVGCVDDDDDEENDA